MQRRKQRTYADESLITGAASSLGSSLGPPSLGGGASVGGGSSVGGQGDASVDGERQRSSSGSAHDAASLAPYSSLGPEHGHHGHGSGGSVGSHGRHSHGHGRTAHKSMHPSFARFLKEGPIRGDGCMEQSSKAQAIEYLNTGLFPRHNRERRTKSTFQRKIQPFGAFVNLCMGRG